MNRREFFILGTALAIPTLSACSEPFTDPALQKLGQELEQWRPLNRQLAASIFPEVKQTSQLLKGVLDPRSYIPIIRPPIHFELSQSETGQLLFDPFTTQENITVLIKRIGGSFKWGWVAKNSFGCKLTLAPYIFNTSAKLPVIHKETLQILDHADNIRLYLSLAQNKGYEFSLLNPHNIPVSQTETEFNWAIRMRDLEYNLNNWSYLDILVDGGSYMRGGALMFANWIREEQLKGTTLSEQTPWIKKGLTFLTPLLSLGLTRRENQVLVWKEGHPPAINSPEYRNLLYQVTGKADLEI